MLAPLCLPTMAVVAGALGEILAWLVPAGNGDTYSVAFLVGGFVAALPYLQV